MPERKRVEKAPVAPSRDSGLSIAIGGLVAGFIFSAIFVAIFARVSHHPRHPSNFGAVVAGLLGLWLGLLGVVLVASFERGRGRPLKERLKLDYGFTLSLWPDVPLGVALGLGAQFLLVPLLELPLVPFVPHLFTRLGKPAQALTNHTSGAGLVLLGVLVCLGSPIVEELYFRGLVLRRLVEALAPRLKARAPLIAVVMTGVLFGLVHFEALQLIGLVGFGILLGTLAWRTKRLGSSIVTHVAFNAVTFISLARTH